MATDVDALITGFNVPLPSGNNHIGVVTVDTMPAQTITMAELPAGTNHIGSVYVDQMTPLPQGTSHIGSVTVDGGLTITSMPPVQVSDSPVATAHQWYENTIDSYDSQLAKQSRTLDERSTRSISFGSLELAEYVS